MAKSKIDQNRTELERLLSYMLLNRPDEFGLVPEQGGYNLKEVLKALAEEGRRVRESSIRELNALALADGQAQPFSLDEEGLIVPTQAAPPAPSPADEVPTLLFATCRRRAHAHTLAHGLTPARTDWVVLADSEELALRIGRRSDQEPILITVEAGRAASQGLYFAGLGEHLFLTNELPAFLLHLPPLPKERPDKDTAKPAKVKESKPFMPAPDRMPGSVELALGRGPDERRQEQRDRNKSKKEWQKDRRDRRRDKGQW